MATENDPPRLPGETSDGAADAPTGPELSDTFYRGLIVFLDTARARGAIRSQSGRELTFEFPFVQVLGAPIGGRAPGLELLRRGDQVGFDVGWTSRGLRVTVIRPIRPAHG